MNLQQTLTLIADLAYSTAQASGMHPAGQLASGAVNIAIYLNADAKHAVQILAEECRPFGTPVQPAPAVQAELGDLPARDDAEVAG